MEVGSDGEEGSAPSGKWCCCLDQGEGSGSLAAGTGGVCRVASGCKGGTPGGMLSRLDVGAFHSKRWKGVTNIPWALEELASRAEP